ncbi:hypothetical protein SSS_09919 [Sarcoptes scabiei]|nr:hypothetical protein SSS_09919 [Sarcoptes scabiei]
MPSSSAATTPTASSTNHHCLENRINLIDDSLIIEENHHSPSHLHQQQYSNNSSLKRDKKPALEMFRKISSGIFNSNGIHTVPDDYNLLNDLKKYDSIRKMNHFNDSTTLISDDAIIHQGSCERKTILKEKKKPSFSFWTTYQICLTNDSLLFTSKSNQQQQTSKSVKKFPLSKWSIIEESNQQCSTMFTLSDHSCSNIYKIRNQTERETSDWIRLINETIVKYRNLHSEDIFL